MYFRNGPNPLVAPKAQHHWFDGDGKLQAMKVSNNLYYYYYYYYCCCCYYYYFYYYYYLALHSKP
jgi:carotenoid cleavage dioxygenase-like enzyme